MFRFFTTAKWALWAWLGSFVILSALWVQVQIDVQINEWFGDFYDMIQKALGEPNAVTMTEYIGGLLSFGKLAALAITLGLATSFLTSHFLFRWRTAMVEWYHEVYDKARTIEGAAQRVQEDTIKFLADCRKSWNIADRECSCSYRVFPDPSRSWCWYHHHVVW